MQEIVEQILNAEEDVRASLEDAKKRATETRTRADEEAVNMVAEARVKAAALSRELMDQARLEASDLEDSLVKEEERKSEELQALSASRMDKLARTVAEVILKTDLKRD